MKEYVYYMPKYIGDKKGVFEFIININKRFKKITNSKVIFNFAYTKFISPTLIAPLGLIFTKIKSNKNEVYLRKTNIYIKKLLIKYGFLSRELMDDESIPQNFIQYKYFNGDDYEGFSEYLYEQLREISNNEIVESLKIHLMEIFINVKMHARKKNKVRYKNKEIFTSGYYDKQKKQLLFAISNNGVSFAENIKAALNYKYEYEYEYLKWAIIKTNSSIKDRSGGLGLYMLSNLVEQCKGELFIVSGKGYYEYIWSDKVICGAEKTSDFFNEFPGTIITVKLPLSNIVIKKIEKSKMTFSDLF